MLYENRIKTTERTHFQGTLERAPMFLENSLLLSMKNKH